jgi:glutamate 5-kinase
MFPKNKNIMAVPDCPVFPASRRLVVKIGSALITNNGKRIAQEHISDWARQIAVASQQHCQVLLVSSGAIACGMQRLGWEKRPRDMRELQACAAIGQMGLAQIYQEAFIRHGRHTAQVLLTHDDLADRKRYLNARSTLNTLLGLGVVPVINENDTVVTDEIRFGDNDTLGALVANAVDADTLLILTDQLGLYSADPRKQPDAQLIPHAMAGDPALEAMAGGAGTHVGTGGMITKVLAAKRAARSGVHTVIASGRVPDVILRVAQGEGVGTRLVTNTEPMAAKKRWLADHLQTAGQLYLDQGAATALQTGKSLLPIGVISVIGEFERGQAVGCIEADGREIARGLVNYSSSEIKRIARHSSREIEGILGYFTEPEVIHRDNLILLN